LAPEDPKRGQLLTDDNDIAEETLFPVRHSPPFCNPKTIASVFSAFKAQSAELKLELEAED
jgi:hypothetical protein